MELKKVVIVGAGFGGLECAKRLAHSDLDVTIIDRQNHHCFQPLLYQVATAALSPADIAWPIRAIVSRSPRARVVMTEVVGVDRENRLVLTNSGVTFPYDHLVLATGATYSYFGHDAWAPFAPGLKRIEDAEVIRRRLLSAFEEAELAQDAIDKKKLLTFAIIGGGPTGVEMAGAIAEIAKYALARDFRSINPRSARIVLIEATDRLLAAFPEHLSRYASIELTRMGVEVRTRSPVTNCSAEGVEVCGSELIPAATLIWAAGVRASDACGWLRDIRCDQNGRVYVEPDLTVAGDPNVFVIGDTALVRQANGRPVPGLAPAAKQMGQYVAAVIAARAAGKAPRSQFRYRHYGDLATIGRRAAIVSLGPIKLRGFVAWVFWGAAHIYYLIGARNKLIVALDWLWDYVTFQRGARLIT